MILDRVIAGQVTVLDIVVAFLFLIVGIIVAKAATITTRRYLKDKVRRNELEILNKVIFYGIIIIVVITILPHLGVDPSGFLVAGGIAGLVIGFASQKIVGNLISGVFLIVERPIKIGDAIGLGDTYGTVVDIHFISTIIKTFDGLYLRIPNEEVFTSRITNYYVNVATRFEYEVGIRYADDADKAIDIIKRVIQEHPYTLINPQPMIYVSELGDNAVVINVRVWAPSKDFLWFSVKRELLWEIKTALEDEGIAIPFPQRELWFRNRLEQTEAG